MTLPAAATRAQIFNLTTPYLRQGITSDERARSELLTVLVKVYASGGENRMHAHVHEDHSFIVLEGEATFHFDGADNTRVLKPYEGVMLESVRSTTGSPISPVRADPASAIPRRDRIQPRSEQ